MTKDLLLRGMIAGLVAAVLATLFARVFAEPQVDLAIAFEAAHAQAGHAMAMAEEPELVSRATQKGLGLLTALALYGAAVGGIFSLVFAACYGRIARIGARSLAMGLALAAFIAITLVPAFKYPPTPPAVGQHETVGVRTIAFFAMTVLSLLALFLAVKLHRIWLARLGAFHATCAAAGVFVLTIALFQFALPSINEVPHDFPAVVLWDFRIAAIATQAVLWVTIGLVFGALARRVMQRAR